MTYENLDVYKLSLQVAVDVYAKTGEFPKSEAFGITSQIRRAAVSIACNIAEGTGRNNPKELVHFIGIARGSCAELLTLIQICHAIGYLEAGSELRADVLRVAKMLTALLKSLRTKSTRSKQQSDVSVASHEPPATSHHP